MLGERFTRRSEAHLVYHAKDMDQGEYIEQINKEN